MSHTEERIWRIVSVLIVLMTAIPQFLDWYYPPKEPPKQERKLEVKESPRRNALTQLRDLGNSNEIEVLMKGKPLNELIVANFVFTYSGPDPIVPEDYVVPIRCRINDPDWIILAVESPQNALSVGATWSKVSDHVYEAEPFLMNPDDRLDVYIYLTRLKGMSDSDPNRLFRGSEFADREEPKIEWGARIARVPRVVEAKDSLSDLTRKYRDKLSFVPQSNYVVMLDGIGPVGFFLAVMLGLFLMYVRLLSLAGLLGKFSLAELGLIGGSSLLCVATAEVITHFFLGTYLDGYLELLTGQKPSPPFWPNVPIVIAFVGILLYLIHKAKQARENPTSV